MAIAEIRLPNGDIAEINVPDSYTDDQVNEWVKSQDWSKYSAEPSVKSVKAASKKERGALRGFTEGVRQLAKGATFGLNDEIGAALVSPFAALSSGENIIDAYRGVRDAYRGQQQEFEADNPKTALGLNVSGGLLSGGYGAAKLAGTGLIAGMPVLKGAATIGGIEGAVGGYGNSESDTLLGDVGNTMKGGLLGAGIGGAVPVVGRVIGKGYSGVKNAVENLKGPANKVDRVILDALERDGLTPEMFAAKLRKLGPEALPADVFARGNAGYTILDELANRPGAGADKVYAALQARNARSLGNARQSVLQNVSPLADKFNKTKTAIQTATSEAAAPLYKEAYGIPVQHTKGITDLMDLRHINKRLNAAAMEVADDLRLPQSVRQEARDYLQMLKNPATAPLAKPSVAMLDAVKKQLNDVSGAALKRGKKNAASQAKSIYSAITDELDSQNKPYSQARAVFEKGKRVENAMDEGRNIFKTNVEDSAELIDGIRNQEELFGMRAGAGRSMLDAIESTKMTVEGNVPSVMNRIASQYRQQEALKNMLSPREYARFMRDLQAEQAFRRTSKIFGGSPTAKRLAQDGIQDPAGVAQNVADIATGNIKQGGFGLIRKINEAISGRAPSKAYDDLMAKRLLDPREVETTLRALREKADNVPMWVKYVTAKNGRIDNMLKNAEGRKRVMLYLSGATVGASE